MRIHKSLGELAAAHRLMNHGGSCELLHGHNWSVRVWIEKEPDSKSGIAVDFLSFDKFWEELVRDFDHGIWLHNHDELASTLELSGVRMKLIRTPGEPTAETMAEMFLSRLVHAFPGADGYGVFVGEMAGCEAEAAYFTHGDI